MDPCCAKRLWRMIRAACCALRRGFSKHKLTMDLHLLFYRGKLAGMSIGNFRTFNHNHQIDPEQDYAHRQLRITDSPYPAEEEEEVANDGGFVDMKAEEFIRWFREQLLLQLSPPATPEYQLSPPASPEYQLRRLRTPARDGSDPA